MSLQVYRRAQGLLALDQGQTLQQAARAASVTYTSVTYNSVSVWRDRYLQEGLALLQDKARSGRPIQIDGQQRAQITAVACSAPPAGHARWSLRLLADKVVELGYVASISHDSIHQNSKKPTQTASQKDLVSEHARQPLFCPHGAAFTSLCFALRPTVSRSVL